MSDATSSPESNPEPRLRITATPLDPGHPGHVLLLVEILPPEGAPRERPPVDLTVLVDRSASMTGDRLAAAVEAVRQVGTILTPADLVTVIAFDTSSQVVMHPTPASPARVQEAVRRLTALGVGQGTNLEAGLRQATEVATRSGMPGAAKTLLVVTDGFAVIGLTEATDLAGLAREANRRGLVVHAVGVGESFDEGVLSAVATAGGGTFSYARHDHDLVTAVQSLVIGEASLAADRTTLKLALGEAVQRYEVVHRLPVQIADRSLEIALGRLYLGQKRPVLLKLRLDPLVDEPAFARVSYALPGGRSAGLLSAPVRVATGEDHPAAAARIGSAWIPLRVARALEEIWNVGNSTSSDEVRQAVEAARQYVFDTPSEFRTSPEAEEAITYLSRLSQEITGGGRVNADLAKQLSEHTTGIFTVGYRAVKAAQPGGWGSDRGGA